MIRNFTMCNYYGYRMKFSYLDEAYDRAKRCLKRIKRSAEMQTSVPMCLFELSDDYFSFFVWCYHVHDWLIEGEKLDKKIVNNFINNCEPLKICADLANGTKHYQLKKGRTGCQPILAGLIVANHPQDGDLFQNVYEIIVGEERHKAIEIAEKCMEEWEKFLKKHALL